MKEKSLGWLYLALVVSLFAGSVNAADSSLVGWWKLDGDVTDSSGNGYDGVIYGDPQWVAGKMGEALHLDGTDDHVVVDGSYILRLYSATVWFRITGGTGQQDIFGAYDPVGARYGASLELGADGRLRYLHRFPFGTSGGTNAYSVASYNDGAWYHAAIVKSPEAVLLYVNGEQVAWAADTTQFDQTPLLLVWGVLRHDNLQRFLVGDLDDVRLYDRPLSVPEIQQIMIGVPPGPASGPSPAEGATDVPRDATLGWTPGEFAQTHDIYLGTSFDDVNEASRSDPRGVLVSQDETAIPYEPVSPLPYGRTQYWRIDEVNGPPDHTVFQGPVWSFTVEPYAYPVTPVAATASSSQPTMEPQRTIDGSGLDESDGHGTEPATMWMSAGVPPNWIQYEFDQVYKLYQVQVWNSNQAIEAFLGFGARKVAIETSTDGRTWTAVPDVPEFAQAPGTPGYAGNTTVSLGGVQAKYVKLTIESNWGGVTPQTGLAEVRFSYVPVQARAPEPANTATEIDVAARLTWRPGREAASHQVYFGTDPNTVANGTIAAHAVTEHGYTPDSLNYGMTYYWRVDEVNAVTYPGEVWSFATQEYAVVDDFESYTDQPGEEIFSTWIDGYADQSSGSTVGLLTAVNGTFGETTIVHGDKQSMPLAYDNTAAPQYSEAVRTFATPQDWTAHGIKSLSLWFRGGPGNGGKLYVKINSTKVAYDGDAGDLARPTWLVWNIDLSQAGNVRSVRTLTIGVEGAGTQGTLYIDDIRLYPKAPEYITPTQASDTALEAHYTFDEGAGTRVGDSSPNANHGTVIGNLQWAAGKVGGAMAFTGSTSDYVEAPEAPNVTGIHSRTATAWIKTTEYGEIVSWGDNVAGQKWIFRVQESNGTLGAIRVEVNGGYQVGSTDVRDDEWHHVAAVLDSDGTPDATEIALYVDGILEANSATLDEPINTAAGVVRIGLAPWHNRPFNGLIDDVRIYSRPLSNAELAGLAGRTIPLHKPF